MAKRTTAGEKRRAHRRRNRAQTLANELKSGPCADCGLTFHPVAMDFDHRPGEAKLHDVSALAYRGNVSGLLAEVAKCDLVCSNCHRIRTFVRRESRCRVSAGSDAPPVAGPPPGSASLADSLDIARARRASTARKAIVPETRDRVIRMLTALRARFGSWHALATAMRTSRERITSALRRGHVSAELAAAVAEMAGLDVDALLRGDPAPGRCAMCDRGSESVS